MKKFLTFTNNNSIQKIWSNNLNREKLKKTEQILCSVSGGQDSVVTFFLIFIFVLVQKRSKNNELIKPKVKIIYCQHFWQVKNFFLPLFLFSFSFNFQLPYIIILPKTTFVTENQSRHWRQKNYFRISQVEKLSNFFTGHTQTDFIEKNLNNILRGTSPKGLMDQKFLYHAKNQTFLSSYIFINSHSISLPKKYFFFNKTFVFIKQIVCLEMFQEPSHFWKEKKIFNKLYKNSTFSITKFVFLDTKFIGSKINKNEPTIFEKKNIQFKLEDYKFIKKIYSSSFAFYSKEYPLKISLNKPIGSFRRSTISELSIFFELPLLIDLTNYSKTFFRNKIRHEMLPFMKSISHKKIENSLKNFFHLVQTSFSGSETEIIEYYFLCKFVNLTDFNRIKTIKFLIFNFKETVQSIFLQKILRDSKNIELTFSQLILIKQKIFF